MREPTHLDSAEIAGFPAGWSMRQLDQLFSFKNGVNADKLAYGQGTPFVNVLEPITYSHLHSQDVQGRVTLSDALRAAYAVQRGDILFNRTSETDADLALATVYVDDATVVFGGFVIRGRPTTDELDILYSGYALRAKAIRTQIIPMGQGAVRANIGQKNLGRVVAPVPPIQEQRAIVTALSDVDTLIAGLERLIAKKRDIKQAAMQQLLTGQTRLPGGNGEWKRVELKRLVREPVTDGPHMTPQFLVSGIPFLSVNNLVDNKIDLTDLRYISVSDDQAFSRKCKPQRGDVLLGKAASVGKVAIVESDLDFNIWSPIALIRANDLVNAKFLYYQLQGLDCVKQIGLLTNASSQGNIGMGDIEKLQIDYPPPTVQTAIASVLTDMDSELSALEARLTKIRAVKQGMMQELLTGRTRLVEPVEQTQTQAVTTTPERKANIYFMRSVLAAEIVDQLHQEPTFGHVKFEKMMFLAEHLCQVDTGSTYLRKAAGPLDSRALHSIDKQLRTQKWFDVRKEGSRYRYVPLYKRGGHKDYFDRYFGAIAPKLSEIVETFRTWDTERCEIVATLYAAWNDLLRAKGTVSDDQIVHEVLNNWHEAKQRIPEDRWLKALGWMRDHGYVPAPAPIPHD